MDADQRTSGPGKKATAPANGAITRATEKRDALPS
jgi:hypothetical protein